MTTTSNPTKVTIPTRYGANPSPRPLAGLFAASEKAAPHFSMSLDVVEGHLIGAPSVAHIPSSSGAAAVDAAAVGDEQHHKAAVEALRHHVRGGTSNIPSYQYINRARPWSAPSSGRKGVTSTTQRLPTDTAVAVEPDEESLRYRAKQEEYKKTFEAIRDRVMFPHHRTTATAAPSWNPAPAAADGNYQLPPYALHYGGAADRPAAPSSSSNHFYAVNPTLDSTSVDGLVRANTMYPKEQRNHPHHHDGSGLRLDASPRRMGADRADTVEGKHARLAERMKKWRRWRLPADETLESDADAAHKHQTHHPPRLWNAAHRATTLWEAVCAAATEADAFRRNEGSASAAGSAGPHKKSKPLCNVDPTEGLPLPPSCEEERQVPVYLDPNTAGRPDPHRGKRAPPPSLRPTSLGFGGTDEEGTAWKREKLRPASAPTARRDAAASAASSLTAVRSTAAHPPPAPHPSSEVNPHSARHVRPATGSLSTSSRPQSARCRSVTATPHASDRPSTILAQNKRLVAELPNFV